MTECLDEVSFFLCIVKFDLDYVFFRGCGIALGGLLSNLQVICTSLQKSKGSSMRFKAERSVFLSTDISVTEKLSLTDLSS